MSDVRKPGNPGGSQGKSCPQHNRGPIESSNSDGAAPASGSRLSGIEVKGATKANANKIR